MQVLVDTDCLKKQIYMCDVHARNASSEEERELFEGLADFLDSIDYAIERNAEVNIVKG
jgi:hypothetical protein